jgi:excisionase family DNA binding protein
MLYYLRLFHIACRLKREDRVGFLRRVLPPIELLENRIHSIVSISDILLARSGSKRNSMQITPRQNKPPLPNDTEIELSRTSSRILASSLDSDNETQKIKVESLSGKEQSLLIPTIAIQLSSDILAQMSQGNAVTLVPVHAELSTQQAANFLNVSRPYLIKLLDAGDIPYRKVGKNRRILAKDLYSYKADLDAKRSRSLDELTALSEELGLYDLE